MPSPPIATAARQERPLAKSNPELRLAFGTTTAFLIAEAFGWYPTFLPAILTATLLASSPGPLPLRAGLALILVQTGGAFAAFALTSWLSDTPLVLFGAISLIIFVSFATMARGRAFFPLLLVLICFATIPIVTISAAMPPQELPAAFARGMALAVVLIWVSHALWPGSRPPSPPPATANHARPIHIAITGTVIVLPLMLVYLMYGITDALPVLITTIVLVVNFDRQRGAAQGLAMMIGNLVGGMIAMICFMLLQVAPALIVLALITFIMTLLFAERIKVGGPTAAVGLVTLNQALVMFSLSLMPGPSDAGIWAARMLQFAIACMFAVGMMILLLPRGGPATSTTLR